MKKIKFISKVWLYVFTIIGVLSGLCLVIWTNSYLLSEVNFISLFVTFMRSKVINFVFRLGQRFINWQKKTLIMLILTESMICCF